MGGGRLLSSNLKGFTLAEGATHVAMLADIRRYAFTLAEVLVTLGIIGVVSAMTVPSLMQNYQRQSYVTQLHKVYNEISQAAVQYQNERNALNLAEAGLNSQDAAYDFFTSYFKIVKTCDTFSDCFANPADYKNLDGSSTRGFSETQKTYILASGAAIRPWYTKSGNSLVNIMVDINGKKGPNIEGRDMFLMCLYNNGLIDDQGTSAPLTKDARENLFTNYCQKTSSGIGGCFGKILNDNWQMTY